SGDDLILTFAGTSDQITIWNTLEYSNGDQIEEIIFDDGTVWTTTDILNIIDGTLPPIIFDLDGDGIYFANQSVSFDFDSDTAVELGAWVDQGDAILALDRDGDGTISSGNEISFVSDLPGARTDLEGLRAFDTNGDGLFSAADEQFSDFLLWTDTNQNGVSDEGELASVVDAGLLALSLSRADFEGAQPNANATLYGETSAIFDTGRSVDVADAALSYQQNTEADAITNFRGQIDDISKYFVDYDRSVELRPGIEFARSRIDNRLGESLDQVLNELSVSEFPQHHDDTSVRRVDDSVLDDWRESDTIELPDNLGHMLSTVKLDVATGPERDITVPDNGIVGMWLAEDQIEIKAATETEFSTIKLSPDEDIKIIMDEAPEAKVSADILYLPTAPHDPDSWLQNQWAEIA
nr:calcium-binding protein [Henriciella sp.]